jgi:hypothetical protein
VPEANSAEILRAVCDTAYDKNPRSCSHSVWDVIKGIVNPTEPYRQANDLIDHMSADWKPIALDAAHDLASKGIVAVGGLKGTPNGHVIVVYPGEKKLNGGYQFLYKKTNKMLTLAGTARYPRCMSTSIGSWPGAMSKGDKTVWDPWANDPVFKTVGFWTPKG